MLETYKPLLNLKNRSFWRPIIGSWGPNIGLHTHQYISSCGFGLVKGLFLSYDPKMKSKKLCIILWGNSESILNDLHFKVLEFWNLSILPSFITPLIFLLVYIVCIIVRVYAVLYILFYSFFYCIYLIIPMFFV